MIHTVTFGGKSRSQVKDVFGEWWDDYQLEAVSPGSGISGNKAFYQYLQEYEGLANFPLDKKYKSDQVHWYARRLGAHLDQRVFTERQPAKDWDERFERAKSTMKNLVSKVTDLTNSISNANPYAGHPPAGGVQPIPEESKEPSSAPSVAPVSAAAPHQESGENKTGKKVKEITSKIKGFFKEKFSSSKPA